MAKAEIIKEYSVKRLKNSFLENIERLDAELVILNSEADRERNHNRNEITLGNILAKIAERRKERETYHNCLCELQRNVSEVEL